MSAETMERHEHFMRRAILVARANPPAPFGAVLVDRESEVVVAEGVNRTRESPTWHGEVDVINRYALSCAEPIWPRLALYTTAEPCPMCQAAILWAGIPNVFFGTSIPTLRTFRWNQIDIRAEDILQRTPFASCTIVGGVLETECDQLFRRKP